jgi:UTP:GlnB (protein PII) uridylyltransferase
LLATEDQIVKIFAKSARHALMGGSAELRELRQALHLLKEAWHAIKEAAEAFDNEEERRR